MFCGYCGTELPDDAVFCGNCGKATSGANVQSSAAVDITDGGKSSTAREQTGAVKAEAAREQTGAGKAEAAREQTGAVKSEAAREQTGAVKSEAARGQTGTGKAEAAREQTGAVKAEAAREQTGFGKGSTARDKTGAGRKNIFSAWMAIPKKDRKKFMISAGIIAVAAVAAVTAGRMVRENRRIGQLEEAIFSISSSYADEKEIARLYEEYDTLSDAAKRKVSNRETLIRAYQEVEMLIGQRRQAAAQVDNLIAAIDNSNVYAEASTLKDAVLAYNGLDDSEKEYVTLYSQLQQAYNEVGNLNVAVTAENFWELFAIEYAVGASTNYGEGTITTQTGYTIDWNWYGGSVTPNYDINTYNDYATPVYVYIAPRYPNLASECSFYMNLHQTYYGIGLVDSDIHEFKLQSATIQYDSSQGVGAYMIAVEDNDASKSLWNLVGMSFDMSDSVHKMNPFDASRVEISDISGSVRY